MDKYDNDRLHRCIATMQPLSSNAPLPAELLLAEQGRLSIHYAPFEYINRSARVVIVGLTPGMHQAQVAINSLRHSLSKNMDKEQALARAKQEASFSGPMRRNLVAMLDVIGLQHRLGLDSCAALFSDRCQLAHFTSVIRNPALVNGNNYSGTPAPLSHPLLLEQIDTGFAKEVDSLRDCWFVPLGRKVAEVLLHLSQRGDLDQQRILQGLPHPSGANAERIAVFTGTKRPETASSKTRPEPLLAARDRLTRMLAGHALHGTVTCQRRRPGGAR